MTSTDPQAETPSPRGIDAVLRRMIADREAIVAARDAELAARDQAIAARDGALAEARDAIAARDHAIAALEREVAALRPQAERLTRLALALEWPDGPRAVLPAARLLRRLTRR